MSKLDALEDSYVPAVDYAGSWTKVIHDQCKTCKRHYVGCYCGVLDGIAEPMCYDPYECLFWRELRETS